MYKFRKKPVEIEAFQMTKERRLDNSEWPQWLHQAWNLNRDEEGALQAVDPNVTLPNSSDGVFHEGNNLEVVTLEGNHLVSWGDFIIRGVKGELYPCKPDIFEQTYDSVAA